VPSNFRRLPSPAFFTGLLFCFFEPLAAFFAAVTWWWNQHTPGVNCRIGGGLKAAFHLPCEPTSSTLNIIWSCGLFEGKGVSTSRVSPPGPLSIS
jgi:hypothetical protein